MLKKKMILLIAGGLSLALALSAVADVFPTSVWSDYYGSASTYNGGPLPVGTIIDAYDTEAIHCGTFVVHTEGHYGLMPVYGDDGYGEGPVIGEALIFYINDRLAVPEDPAETTFGGMGTRMEVNLSASALVSMEPVTATESYFAHPGDTVGISMMVKNTGEGLDFYTVSAETEHGWITKPMLGFVYALPEEAVVVEFEVIVPLAIFYDITELVDFRIQSGTDPNVFINRQVELNILMPTDVNDNTGGLLPTAFRLGQNYPNPFNPITTISYNLTAKANINIEVYDLLGRVLEKFDLGVKDAGNHSFEFDGTSLSSGVYFYRLKAGDLSAVKKMVLMK